MYRRTPTPSYPNVCNIAKQLLDATEFIITIPLTVPVRIINIIVIIIIISNRD